MPITELITTLSVQTTRLVRDEVRLARKELQASAKHAGLGAALVSVAGVLALFAVAALIASAVAGLSLVLPVWVSAVIVGAVLVALACMTALVSRTQIAGIGAPKTMAAVTQDIRTYEIGPFHDDDT